MDHVDFHFSESIDASTFSISDVTRFEFVPEFETLRSLTGAITSVAAVDSDTLRVNFAQQIGDGTYEIEIGPQISSTSGETMPGSYVAAFAIQREPGPVSLRGYEASAFRVWAELPGATATVVISRCFAHRGRQRPKRTSAELLVGRSHVYLLWNRVWHPVCQRERADHLWQRIVAIAKFRPGRDTSGTGDRTDVDNWRSFQFDIVLAEFRDLNNDNRDELVIEWKTLELEEQDGTPLIGTATFQTILELDTGVTNGAIYFNYKEVDLRGFEPSFTVGIKDTGNTPLVIGTPQSDSNPYVDSNRAIRIAAPGVILQTDTSGLMPKTARAW